MKDDVIDLSDVPPQPPIFKSIRRVKEGSSKYIGVYLLASNRWIAKIVIEGKLRRIGIYDNERSMPPLIMLEQCLSIKEV